MTPRLRRWTTLLSALSMAILVVLGGAVLPAAAVDAHVHY